MGSHTHLLPAPQVQLDHGAVDSFRSLKQLTELRLEMVGVPARFPANGSWIPPTGMCVCLWWY